MIFLILLEKEIEDPSVDFCKFFASKVYNKSLTEKRLEWFKNICKVSIEQFFREEISNRLNKALDDNIQKTENIEIEEINSEDQIVITEEELEGYRIVVAILVREIEKERIFYRDTKSYFGILLDNNNRKPICRLYLNSPNIKYIETFCKESREGTKIKIESVNDIYKYQKDLLSVISYYEKAKNYKTENT